MKLFSRKENPHARSFGVEIECGIDGGLSVVADLFNFSGSAYDGFGENEAGWNLHEDGSGVELSTPILQGEAGFATVRDAMERLKGAGAFVTEADGLHIHHDAPEFVGNPANCVHLVDSWRNNQDVIHQMVAERRRSSSACRPWQEDTHQKLAMWADGSIDTLHIGRHDLNIAALREHGSIELRLHEGTLDADVAIAWIMFGQQFLHRALKAKPIKASPTDVELMSRLKLSKAARAILAEKKNQGYVTKASSFKNWHDDYDEDDDYDDY